MVVVVDLSVEDMDLVVEDMDLVDMEDIEEVAAIMEVEVVATMEVEAAGVGGIHPTGLYIHVLAPLVGATATDIASKNPRTSRRIE
jgi:hypothetical protein